MPEVSANRCDLSGRNSSRCHRNLTNAWCIIVDRSQQDGVKVAAWRGRKAGDLPPVVNIACTKQVQLGDGRNEGVEVHDLALLPQIRVHNRKIATERIA